MGTDRSKDRPADWDEPVANDSDLEEEEDGSKPVIGNGQSQDDDRQVDSDDAPVEHVR